MAQTVTLGKYEIRRELGRGAMGVVYEAFDTVIERTVALKTIRRDQLEGDEAQQTVARFLREAKAAGRLSHPGVVAVYDYGEEGGTSYIAMEFVRGQSLKDYFERNERFPIAQTARVMHELLDALAYAHDNGIVHRDIKPANIMLLENGRVKVADFGIARIQSSEFTQAGQILGTPSYMSPEQFMGQPVDGRSDLFSAGVLLYQLLTGERPFTGAATTIMHKVLMEDPLPPSRLNVQVPKPFDAVIRKAMAKRPEDRFQSAAALSEAIHAAADNRMPQGIEIASDATMAVSAAEATLVTPAESIPPAASRAEQTRADIAPAAGGPASNSSSPVAATVRSNRPAVLALAGVVGIAAIAAAWMLWTRAPTPAVTAAMPTEPKTATASATPTPRLAPANLPAAEPGSMVFSAIGLSDASDQSFKSDQNAAATAARTDARRQLVEKAVALYLDPRSLAKHYEAIKAKLLAHSDDFVSDVSLEAAPVMGKDGIVQVTTVGTVKVKDVQKALDRMSREERMDFIRNNGDPKIAVAISVREDSGSPAQPSLIAENILKARIKSFGFRIWSDDSQSAASPGADFLVTGEAAMRKLSAKLAASGITIEKFLVTSWTIKAVERASGEEIYYNNKLPTNMGSMSNADQALQEIGTRIADEFSRDFFLQHFMLRGRRVALRIDGLPNQTIEQSLAREVPGLPQVALAAPLGGGSFDLLLIGSNGPLTELIARGVLAPLNAKFGIDCLVLGGASNEEISVRFDAKCNDAAVLARFDANPPASLYAAPPARRSEVIKNPEMAKKLTI